MDKLLTTLKIEHWYHVFIILGCVGMIVSLVFDLKGVANIDAFLLFTGVMLIGVGEWINHPLQTGIVRPNVYAPGGGIVRGHPRKNKFIGVSFDILGVVALAAAAYKIVKSM